MKINRTSHIQETQTIIYKNIEYVAFDRKKGERVFCDMSSQFCSKKHCPLYDQCNILSDCKIWKVQKRLTDEKITLSNFINENK